MPKRVAIVGAGIGGLSSALRLAHKGSQVTVFEKLAKSGGRNNLLESSGFLFDMGPSFVMMPEFFSELFSSCDLNIDENLNLKVLDEHYRIFFADGRKLSVYQDPEKTIEQLQAFEPGVKDGYVAFLSQTKKIFDLVKPLLYRCVGKTDLANPSYWPLLFKLKVFESYWDIARRYFKTQELCYAFTFEAMFMGVSPFHAPAFYSVITYADHVQKIRHAMGGMYTIPRAIEKCARDQGVEFHYNCEVSGIYQTKKNKVALKLKGEEFEFDSVVVNADYAYAQEKLLGRSIPNYEYSCSVYLLYWGLKQKVSGLAHHNLFFASDLRKNLNDIFKTGLFPQDPSFYIHIPTVTDASLAPQGKDIVYCLIPVPNVKIGKDLSIEEKNCLKNLVIHKVKQATGVDIGRLIEVEHEFTPQDFISKYNIRCAATFGLAHNLMQSAFFRPANRDPYLKNVFYSGASTQPGGGLPVVIASSRIVADMILKE